MSVWCAQSLERVQGWSRVAGQRTDQPLAHPWHTPGAPATPWLHPGCTLCGCTLYQSHIPWLYPGCTHSGCNPSVPCTLYLVRCTLYATPLLYPCYTLAVPLLCPCCTLAAPSVLYPVPVPLLWLYPGCTLAVPWLYPVRCTLAVPAVAVPCTSTVARAVMAVPWLYPVPVYAP